MIHCARCDVMSRVPALTLNANSYGANNYKDGGTAPFVAVNSLDQDQIRSFHIVLWRRQNAFLKCATAINNLETWTYLNDHALLKTEAQ